MVHTYQLNGYNIAVDGNSGSVHLLDEISYQILDGEETMPSLEKTFRKLNQQFKEENLANAHNELLMLVGESSLFSSIEEIEQIPASKNVNTSVKALCLHVAHDCNLRCEYCFASEGDYNSGRKLMNKEVALKAVDYLVENSEGRQKIEIDFFGGEPLMNFNLVKEVVNYGREIEKKKDKRFYFTITTNGVLLDSEKIAFINEHMDNVVISVDGRKEKHDAIRQTINGKGTYDVIVPKTQELVKGRNGKSYFVRGTFTSKNKDFSKDAMHLGELGFKEISVEPVVGSGSHLHFTKNDLPEIMNEYENLALKYIEQLKTKDPFRFYHFYIDLQNGPCLFKRITACGAGYEYLAVSPEGKLYPCHQFVGEDEFMVGDIYSGISNQDLCDRLEANTIFEKQECRECWVKLYCSGGCHANAYFTNSDIKKPNEISCQLQKKRIECALMIAAWRATEQS